MFRPIKIDGGSLPSAQTQIDDAAVRRVFMVLHGMYGNLFLTKFSTGAVENGEDQGIANARRMWAHGLREFDSETVKAALRMCQARHLEFPPSLPQFVALCAANQTREAYRPAVPALGMSQGLRSQSARRAREIIARHEAKAAAMRTGHIDLPPGLDGLKVAIANAIGLAGGDEVKALRDLDLMLAAPKKEPAHA